MFDGCIWQEHFPPLLFPLSIALFRNMRLSSSGNIKRSETVFKVGHRLDSDLGYNPLLLNIQFLCSNLDMLDDPTVFEYGTMLEIKTPRKELLDALDINHNTVALSFQLFRR